MLVFQIIIIIKNVDDQRYASDHFETLFFFSSSPQHSTASPTTFTLASLTVVTVVSPRRLKLGAHLQ
jgi:hypothetical protein